MPSNKSSKRKKRRVEKTKKNLSKIFGEEVIKGVHESALDDTNSFMHIIALVHSNTVEDLYSIGFKSEHMSKLRELFNVDEETLNGWELDKEERKFVALLFLPREPLKINPEASDHKIVRQAICVANRVLASSAFRSVNQIYLQCNYQANVLKLMNIKIEFGSHQVTSSGSIPFAWIISESQTDTIYIHQYFRDRIDQVLQKLDDKDTPACEIEKLNNEVDSTCFIFMYLILHELFHTLVMRCQGKEDRLDPIYLYRITGNSDAGAFFTKRIFGCDLLILVPVVPGSFGPDIVIDGVCTKNRNYKPEETHGEPQFIRVCPEYIHKVVKEEISPGRILDVQFATDRPVLPDENSALVLVCGSPDEDINFEDYAGSVVMRKSGCLYEVDPTA